MKPKAIAVFFADAHLDTNNWSSHPELSGDSVSAFHYIVRSAADIGVSHVFCAGDFFDERKPPAEVIQAVRQEMDYLEHKNIGFSYIQGQHDLSSPPWLAAIHDWPVWLHEIDVKLTDGQCVYGIDWTPAHQLSSRLQSIPSYADILLCHQVWSDFMGNLTTCEGSFDMIPHVSQVFTGDFHKRVHWESGKARGKNGISLEVLSPGSTNIRSINEKSDKYFATLLEDGSWSWHRIPTRRKLEVVIADTTSLARTVQQADDLLDSLERSAIHAKVPVELEIPILYVKYNEVLADAPARLDAAFGKKAFIFYKRTRMESDEESDEAAISRKQILSAGVTNCLELVMDKNDKRYKSLASLIRSEDPQASLSKMRTKFIDDQAFAED